MVSSMRSSASCFLSSSDFFGASSGAGARFRFGRGFFGRRALALGLLAHEVVVENEFVAVRDQEIGGRILDADADHRLVVLAQLGDERRKIRVAADDDERIDVRLGVAEVQRIDDHADIRGVLAGHAHVRNFDQLERGFVHRALEALVAVPVAVGFLDDDAAFQEQALEHLVDVEFRVLGVGDAERHVLEIAEQRHVGDFGLCSHCCSVGMTAGGMDCRSRRRHLTRRRVDLSPSAGARSVAMTSSATANAVLMPVPLAITTTRTSGWGASMMTGVCALG